MAVWSNRALVMAAIVLAGSLSVGPAISADATKLPAPRDASPSARHTNEPGYFECGGVGPSTVSCTTGTHLHVDLAETYCSVPGSFYTGVIENRLVQSQTGRTWRGFCWYLSGIFQGGCAVGAEPLSLITWRHEGYSWHYQEPAGLCAVLPALPGGLLGDWRAIVEHD